MRVTMMHLPIATKTEGGRRIANDHEMGSGENHTSGERETRLRSRKANRENAGGEDRVELDGNQFK